VELYNSAQEQQKITEKRLTEMLADRGAGVPRPLTARLAQVANHISGEDIRKEGMITAAYAGHRGVGGITSHVLDTCHGRPAQGVTIRIEARLDTTSSWSAVASATTNEQGRVTLLENGKAVVPGRYRVTFDLAGYYGQCRRDNPEFFKAMPSPFFPEAAVVFDVNEDQWMRWDHFHIPLTWSPFGYSTYRGS
jgi:hydroxyisourate hydrolase